MFFNQPQASELGDKSILELELQDFTHLHLYCFQLHVCKSHLGNVANTAIAWGTFWHKLSVWKIHGAFLYTKFSLTKSSNTATEEMKKYVP